jgi:hypothetical protein
MNLHDKLKGLPTIYYINLDHRTDRKEYMESQFDYWGIKDYHRVSASKYLASEYNEWEHLVLDKFLYFGIAAVANSITHIEMIKNWLETSNEPYMIMMEDDYDLSLIEHWNFDWEYLMNNIPENWDCIQLGFENPNIIPFFLHPVHYSSGFGPCLINRYYAKKIIRMHYVENKFKLNLEINEYNSKAYGSVDEFIRLGGKTYSLPLITTNTNLGSDYSPKGTPRPWFFKCRELYYDWWQNEHHKFSLDDFFTYGKPNDYKMIKKVNFFKKNNNFNYT